MVHQFLQELEKFIKELHDDGKCKEILGHAINNFHYDRVCSLLTDHKGTVVIGNSRAHIDKKLEPTVVLNPVSSSPLMTEEIFGPILPIITYKNIDEAINFIGQKEKPLVIYYFGSNSNSNKNLFRV